MTEHSPTDKTTRYWTVVTRGLESIARDELLHVVPQASEVEASYRRVTFRYDGQPEQLLSLRTIDDLFIDVGAWQRIGRPRDMLHRFYDLASSLDLRDAAALCAELRPVGMPPLFSVTANFVGRRNYSTDEIKAAVAGGVEAAHRWDYEARDNAADLNLRVFIEHELAYVGVRLAATPLHERPYKQASIAGSLKPTVAAAMIRFGGFEPGSTLIDPFCGAGTIPIEGALMGYRTLGGDHGAEALRAAHTNRDAAGVAIELQTWDARSLPLPDASVDGMVCNLPWDRQIEVDDSVERLYMRCLTEMARVVRPGGACVLLTNLQPLLRTTATEAGFVSEEEREISVSGQTPLISRWRKPTQ